MPRITEESVTRIKDSTDIVAVVGRYLQLRRSGTAWKACCPFHNEKTPSFHVNPARQTFHCFGCGVGGDAAKFIMMHDNVDYPTALRRLADMNGVPVIEEEENPELARQRRLRGRVVELNAAAAAYYNRLLCRSKAADHARAYLKGRGINIDIAKAWGLGWAPPDFRELGQLAAAKGMDTRLLTEAYLLGKGSSGLYPVFRDRLMFPIHNVRGEVVGFSGRVISPTDRDPRKYVNTAETVAFRKGELLFGLHKATSAIGKAGMSVVICEGQLDVIACHELAEVRNAVAGLGTAFTDEHARTLAKYAKKATLCYDGDQAGINASEKTYRKLAQAGLEVYLTALPPGEDPDSLIRTRGAEALQQALSEARPYLEQRATLELRACGGDAAALAALVPRMADLAAEIPNALRRDLAVADLATRLHVGLESFRAAVENILLERKRQPRAAAQRRYSPPEEEEEDWLQEGGGGAPEPRAHITPIRLHPAVRGLIELACSSERAQGLLLDRVEELQEPIRHLEGGVILQRVLEQLPTPGDAAAWADFTRGLPPEQGMALRHTGPSPMPEEGIDRHVEDTCARAARDTLRARLDRLRAQVANPQLEPEERTRMVQEMHELHKILSIAPTPHAHA